MPNDLIIDRLAAIQDMLIAAHAGGKQSSSSSRGTEREVFVKDFLSAVMPPPFRFGSGDITDMAGETSGQVDVVVEYPIAPSLPLLDETKPRIYLAEGVAAVIEVKSNLNKSKWDEVRDKCESVKGLVREWHIEGGEPQSHPRGLPLDSLPFFAVGYTGWKSTRKLREYLDAGGLDGMLVIDRGLFVSNDRFGAVIQEGSAALWGLVCALQQATSLVAGVRLNSSRYALDMSSQVSRLLAGLESEIPGDRTHCAHGLARYRGAAKQAQPRLLQIAANDDVSPVRHSAIRALGMIGTHADDVVPALMRMLDDQDLGVRLASATALGLFGTRARPTADRLVEIVESRDEEPRLREQAMVALKNIQADPEREAAAIASCIGHEHVGGRAAELIGFYGKSADTAVPRLIDYVESLGPDRVRVPMISLGRIGSFEAAQWIVEKAQATQPKPGEGVGESLFEAAKRQPDIVLPALDELIRRPLPEGEQPNSNPPAFYALPRLQDVRIERGADLIPALEEFRERYAEDANLRGCAERCIARQR